MMRKGFVYHFRKIGRKDSGSHAISKTPAQHGNTRKPPEDVVMQVKTAPEPFRFADTRYFGFYSVSST
ncbi:MAG: hypothetical protein LBB61_00115 [Treponema sp.]|jgi:hypothetical protein|nr:hypothetical protein [Treponema sp.]